MDLSNYKLPASTHVTETSYTRITENGKSCSLKGEVNPFLNIWGYVVGGNMTQATIAAKGGGNAAPRSLPM